MGMDAAGQFEMRVMPDFEWAWELSGQIFDRVFGSPDLTFADAFSLAIQALGLNYRIGRREASQLGLITTENFQAIFEAAVDWKIVHELLLEQAAGEEAIKKKDEASVPEPANTSDGPEAHCPITDRAEAICI